MGKKKKKMIKKIAEEGGQRVKKIYFYFFKSQLPHFPFALSPCLLGVGFLRPKTDGDF